MQSGDKHLYIVNARRSEVFTVVPSYPVIAFTEGDLNREFEFAVIRKNPERKLKPTVRSDAGGCVVSVRNISERPDYDEYLISMRFAMAPALGGQSIGVELYDEVGEVFWKGRILVKCVPKKRVAVHGIGIVGPGEASSVSLTLVGFGPEDVASVDSKELDVALVHQGGRGVLLQLRDKGKSEPLKSAVEKCPINLSLNSGEVLSFDVFRIQRK